MFNTMKCPRCAKKINANKATCPFCGLNLFALPSSRSGKSRWPLQFIIGAIVIMASVEVIVILITNPHPRASSAKGTALDTPGDTADGGAADRVLRIQAATQAGKALSDAARPGGRAIVEEARASRNGDTLCVRYHIEDDRGRRAPVRLVYYNQIPYHKDDDWTAYCSKASIDMIDSVETAVQLR